MMGNLNERFEFGTIDPNDQEMAEYAVYMESVCLPPTDACTGEPYGTIWI